MNEKMEELIENLNDYISNLEISEDEEREMLIGIMIRKFQFKPPTFKKNNVDSTIMYPITDRVPLSVAYSLFCNDDENK